ncbi:MAG: FliG C-terminal domain-containing protein [Pseudomonadota bacterium]
MSESPASSPLVPGVPAASGPETAPGRNGTGKSLTTPRSSTNSTSATQLLPEDRAAVILLTLGPETAAKFLSEVDEHAVRRFAKAVNRMRTVSASIVDVVIADFIESVRDQKTLHGGPNEIRRYLSEVLERDQVEQIVLEVEEKNRSVWTKLGEVEDAKIASLLKVEHPRVAAFTLTRLAATKAARVLENLEPDLARSIVLRMSDIAAIDPDVVQRIGDVIGRDFLSTEQRSKHARRPIDIVAGVMNHIGNETREDLLGHMDERNPELARNVRRVMFTFNNIAERVRPRDVPALVKAFDPQTLLIACKGGGPVVDFVLENISKRMAERLEEEVKELTDISRKEIELARNEMTSFVQDMAKRGAIQLIDSEAAEEG